MPKPSDDPIRSHTVTSPDAHTVVEEAYRLALDGRPQAAHRLIDHALDWLGSEATESQLERLRLARAQLLSKSSSTRSREEATEYLEELSAASSNNQWRAHLHLARIFRERGDRREAAQHLQAAVALFKANQPGVGPLRNCLATMLSEEVKTLTSLQEPDERSAPAAEAQLRAVLDFSRELVSQTDSDKVLQVVLRQACKIMGADRGLIALIRDEDIEVAAAENLERDPLGKQVLEVSRTLVRDIISGGTTRSFAIADHGPGHPARRSLTAMGVHHVLCVPIRGIESLLGVLYLDWRSDDSVAPNGKGELCEVLAAQAAAALESASRLHDTERALASAEETVRQERLKHRRRESYGGIIGASAAMQQVYDQLDMMARSNEPVVILGETGTGKDLVAELLHARGPHSDRELVAINCASLPEMLLESELFGYERGAFTGADRSRPGLMEIANGGTLFLDEVGDMSARMQADLLRVIQSGELRRLGGRRTFHVSFRILAATHRDLEQRVADGEFREDLYYRLNVLSLHLPPLRNRAEDIPHLVEAILERLAAGRPMPRVSAPAMIKLTRYFWPGNVRELENTLRSLVALGRETIEPRDLPERVLRSDRFAIKAGTLKEAEAQAIRRALDVSRGNKVQAARLLGIDRGTLYSKLKSIGE